MEHYQRAKDREWRFIKPSSTRQLFIKRTRLLNDETNRSLVSVCAFGEQPRPAHCLDREFAFLLFSHWL